jgi:hypothetical protein
MQVRLGQSKTQKYYYAKGVSSGFYAKLEAIIRIGVNDGPSSKS